MDAVRRSGLLVGVINVEGLVETLEEPSRSQEVRGRSA